MRVLQRVVARLGASRSRWLRAGLVGAVGLGLIALIAMREAPAACPERPERSLAAVLERAGAAGLQVEHFGTALLPDGHIHAYVDRAAGVAYLVYLDGDGCVWRVE